MVLKPQYLHFNHCVNLFINGEHLPKSVCEHEVRCLESHLPLCHINDTAHCDIVPYISSDETPYKANSYCIGWTGTRFRPSIEYPLCQGGDSPRLFVTDGNYVQYHSRGAPRFTKEIESSVTRLTKGLYDIFVPRNFNRVTINGHHPAETTQYFKLAEFQDAMFDVPIFDHTNIVIIRGNQPMQHQAYRHRPSSLSNDAYISCDDMF